MFKWIITLVIVLVVAGVGGGLWWSYAKANAQATAPQATGTVERGTLRVVVSTTGRVVSNLEEDIKCKASGAVIYLPYDESDFVKKDEVLLRLDTVDEDRAIAKAKAALDSSIAKLAQAKQNLVIAKQNLVTDRARAEANLALTNAKKVDAHTKADRLADLLAKKLAAQEDYDTALTTAAQSDADLKLAEAQMEDLKSEEFGIELKEKDIEAAQADVNSNQVDLDIQNQQKDYTTVTSPMDGVVISQAVQLGSLVQSGTSNVSGGTTVMTITELSQIFVYASVDESGIGQVQLGQNVDLTADAYPGVHFQGNVVVIAPKGVNTSNVVTYEVRIEVVSANKSLLKPEMTSNVDIINTEKPDVLLVPSQAVIRKRPTLAKSASDATTRASTQSAGATGDDAAASQPGGRRGRGPGGGSGGARRASPRNGPTPATVTLVKSDNTTEVVDITVGQNDDNSYEVLSGLNGGETVVLNKSSADSRWRQGGFGGGRGGGLMPR